MSQYKKYREREEMRLQTTTKQKEDHVPLVIIYNLNNPPLSKTTKELLPILHSTDRTKKAVPIPPIIAYKRPSTTIGYWYISLFVVCGTSYKQNKFVSELPRLMLLTYMYIQI